MSDLLVLSLATAPAAEPLSTADAKTHLRVTGSTDDTYIDGLVTAARRYIEVITGRALINQTFDEYWDEWPTEEILLSRSPLVSVTGLYYTDSAGTETTVSTSLYDVDTKREPGRITLGYGDSWPTATLHPRNPIRARYVAGYGTAGSSVPTEIVHALKLMVSHWYDNREAVGSTVAGAELKAIPLGVDALLANYRVHRF